MYLYYLYKIVQAFYLVFSQDAIYEFGRDFNGVLTLLELETLDLSYNTITTLDQSLVSVFCHLSHNILNAISK